MVNLKDASLIKSWTDIDGSEVKTSHHITRSYNSRSLSTGRFGFGWCSSLDIDLTVRTETVVEVDFCMDRQEFHKKTPNEWRSGSDVLRKNKETFTLTRAGGEIYRFNSEGKLIHVKTPQSNFKLVYRFGSLVALSDRNSQMLHILTDSTSGRVLQMKYGGHKLDYVYSDTDLAEVKYNDKSFSKFIYDPEHNLTRVEYPDRSREVFEYDTATDRLTGAIRRDGCREVYRYQIKSSENFVSSAVETCGKHERLLSQIEFFFRTTAGGDSYLERMRTVAAGQTFETDFRNAGGLD